MKNIFAFSLSLLLLFSFCACNKSQDKNIDYLDLIFEIRNEIGDNFNHKNAIDSTPIYFVDESVSKEKILEIDNNEMKLEYSDTLHYPVSEKRVHRYYVDGDQNRAILIDQNGKVNALLYKFAKLNISNTASPNEVLPLLEKELIKWFDLSFYKHIDIPEQRSQDTAESKGFLSYDFLYYNIADGYITDFVRVSVNDDGSVLGLSIFNVSLDCSMVTINKDLEKELLNLKLNDIYTTDTTKYIDYEISFPPQIVVYNGKLYTQHHISAQYKDKKTGAEMSSYINTILIPVEVLNKS